MSDDLPNNTNNDNDNDNDNDTTQWSCDACGCRTNTTSQNEESCAACGTSRRGIGSAVIRRRPPLPPPSQIRRRFLPRDRTHVMMNFQPHYHPSLGIDDADSDEDLDENDLLAHHHHHQYHHYHPDTDEDDEEDDASSLLVDQEILERVFLGVAGGSNTGGRSPSDSTRAALEALQAHPPPPPDPSSTNHPTNQLPSANPPVRLDRFAAMAAGRRFDPSHSTTSQPPPPPSQQLPGRYTSRNPPPAVGDALRDPSTHSIQEFLRDVRRAGGGPPPLPSTPIDPMTLHRLAEDGEGNGYNPQWSREETMGVGLTGGRGPIHIRPQGGSNRRMDAGRRGGVGGSEAVPAEVSVLPGFPNVAHVYERGKSGGGGSEGRCAVAQPSFPRMMMGRTGREEYGGEEGEGVTGEASLLFESLLAPIPPGGGGASSSSGGGSSNSGSRRVFGFRVAFDHPEKETGEAMGGYHMVGVANSSHFMWGLEDGGRTFERISHLPGVGGGGGMGGSMRRMDNIGHSDYYRSRIAGADAFRRGQRGGSTGLLRPPPPPSPHPTETSTSDSTPATALSPFAGSTEASTSSSPPHGGFGCRDVITVVVDLDSRTLTYWRNEVVLGTLVRNIPSSGSCFPIAVPLEGGVSVAITGMAGDPLAVLSSFKEAQIKKREERLLQRNLALSRQRDILINKQEGGPSPDLLQTLTTIFSWYTSKANTNSLPTTTTLEPATTTTTPAATATATTTTTTTTTTGMRLNSVQATRLWYRCGIKLSHLQSLLDASRSASTTTATATTTAVGEEGGDGIMMDDGPLQQPYITLCDFLDLIRRIIADDENILKSEGGNDNDNDGEGGERPSDVGRQSSGGSSGGLHFQVGNHVEVVGDVSNGPLSPGDHGVVVEGSKLKGKTHLIRVFCNGRHWLYHPQSLIVDKSGLVESPTVQFLIKILRAHGYDEKIQLLWGKLLTGDSWQEGDLVMCFRNPKVCDKSTIGRIVEGMPTLPSSSSAAEMSRLRASAMVLVECPNHLFGRSISMLNSGGSVGSSSMALTRRIPITNLRHTTFYHGFRMVDDMALKSGDNCSVHKESFGSHDVDDDSLDGKINNNNGSLFQCNDGLRSSVADVKKLDIATMEAFENECKRNPASLPGLFGMGLSEAILSAVDYTKDNMVRSIKCEKDIPKIEGSSIAALGSLARCVCHYLFSSDRPSNLKSGHMTEQFEDATTPFSGDVVNTFSPSVAGTNISAFGGNTISQHEFMRRNDQHLHRGDDHQSLSMEYNNRTRRFFAMISDSQDSRSNISSALSSNLQFINNRARMPHGPNEDEMQRLPSFHPNAVERSDGDFQISRTAISRRDGQPSNFLGRRFASNLDLSINAANSGYDMFLPNTSQQQRDNTSISWPPLPSQERSPLGHAQDNNALNSESFSGTKNMPLLQTLLRGSGAVTLSSIATSKLHGSSTNKIKQVKATMKSVINNGILTGDLQWMKRSMTNEVGGKILYDEDEDGWSTLLLAVSFGCSRTMLKVLIEGGSQVTERVIREAAITNQTRSLSYLLRHTFYDAGTIDLSFCSNDVRNIIQSAIKRQQAEETKMRKEAGHFASCLLQKLLQLGLTVRLHSRQQGVSSYFNECSSATTDLLVSNVLFCALQCSQEESRNSLSSDESSKLKISHEKSQNLSQQLPDGLLHILPSDIIVNAISTPSDTNHDLHETDTKEDIYDDSCSTAIIYLQLTESYLWSKEISDIAVGLSLARYLLATKPFYYSDHIERYGIKMLAISHADLAKEKLSQLDASNVKSACKIRENKTKPASSHAVFCPKDHLSALHLTRHSDFRCNLCEKQVEKGHLMYGCRKCDWDACQNCMDRCEGGYVKWKLVNRLALECQQLISDLRDGNLHLSSKLEGTCPNERQVEKNLNSRSDEIQRISRGIRRLQTDSLKQLSGLLLHRDPLTIFEFNNILLPSLHSAIMGSACPTPRIIPKDEVTQDSYRRCKKPRLGGSTPMLFNVKEREDFIRALIIALILDPIKSNSKTHDLEITPISSQNSAGTTDAYTEVMRMEIADNDEEEGGNGQKDVDKIEDQRANNNVILSGTPLPAVPPLLQYLHTILSFYERATQVGARGDIGRAMCPTDHQNGELHSLTIPFDVDLQPSPSRHNEQHPHVNAAHIKSEGSKISCAIIHVEPLISFSDFQMHVLRTRPIQLGSYSQFCKRLVLDKAVIVESSTPSDRRGLGEGSGSFLRIARILDFDERSGSHLVKFSSELIPKDQIRLHSCNIRGFLSKVEFNDEELLLILAARDYRILHREESCNIDTNSSSRNEGIFNSQMEMDSSRLPVSSIVMKSISEEKSAFMLMVGTLVECKLDSNIDSWQPCTIKDSIMIPLTRHDNIIEKWPDDYRPSYTLVSNLGVVVFRVVSNKIRDHQLLLDRQCHEKESWNTNKNIEAKRMLGKIDARLSRHSRSNQTTPLFLKTAVLKRSWSALSLTQNLKPHDIDCPNNSSTISNPSSPLRKRLYDGNVIGRGNEAEYEYHLSIFEKPPQITVDFSLHESVPCASLNSIGESTFFSALRHLLVREKTPQKLNLAHQRKCRLFYSFSCKDSCVKEPSSNAANECMPAKFCPPWTKSSLSWDETLSTPDPSSSIFERRDFNASSRNRTVTKASTGPNNSNVLCLALDDSCLRTVNLLCIMADRLSRTAETDLVHINATTTIAQLLQMFESESLSKKLRNQLEDPMTVVAGALPEWCTVMPMYAPVLFSHISRRLFLNRYAFGVSRSLLRQQEAKVAVAPLRQRMAALRGRAVELVGEAFSGGASDPMALQLQADELYGMEEALKSRVTAAFRKQKWRERSLESVKAVVHRDSLLSDAAFVMGRYSTASRLKKRRLEVRFEGESGFDAASGDEAGVTRGFYADVAEALLSCDHIAGIHLVSTFPKKECALNSYLHEEKLFLGTKRTRVPLWIPDVDPSNSLIIPSPRADRSTTLGVFPRPISHNHPQSKCVMEQFQLMGRLFAASMRDGFTFPLPLSASFLKLVQVGSDGSKRQNNMTDRILTTSHSSSVSCVSNMSDPFPFPSSMAHGINMSVDDTSNMSYSVDSANYLSDLRASFTYPFEECLIPEDKIASRGASTECEKVASKLSFNCGLDRFHLSSGDLPRPGFLGGEVFAVEEHICKALDQLDGLEHMLPRIEFLRRKNELASDRLFAKKALGQSYECSFEEYFEDKTFVDPLDPTQGEGAAPLCPNGHLCPVTIENVREWVVLAKQFILFDGVIAQALAFRQGVNDFFPIRVLCMFTPEELQCDVCGGGDKVKDWNEEIIRSLLKLDGGKGAAEALIAVTAMGGEGGAVLSRRFGPSSPTISYLIKALLEASEFRRRQFLSFVTSVPIVTPGQIEVVLVVTPSGDFLPMSDPGCLPRANTCGRKLYLPKFNSYESFLEVLWAVVTAECRFKGFFEWRG